MYFRFNVQESGCSIRLQLISEAVRRLVLSRSLCSAEWFLLFSYIYSSLSTFDKIQDNTPLREAGSMKDCHTIKGHATLESSAVMCPLSLSCTVGRQTGQRHCLIIENKEPTSGQMQNDFSTIQPVPSCLFNLQTKPWLVPDAVRCLGPPSFGDLARQRLSTARLTAGMARTDLSHLSRHVSHEVNLRPRQGGECPAALIRTRPPRWTSMASRPHALLDGPTPLVGWPLGDYRFSL